ncbi:hypothetical protein FVE85_1569 [Porphyridium purpureum]|uniref:Kinetochore protein Sos7 coiled-coil domain-containing protein n=1 Tax=Porphyridium purpureum TaxID=35688 RepID=A0A5J4YXL7_PORPP|nr:hypothetical protein FVE85_1569 [Porphyridium purpureum]|eukprot:POR4503..scf209_3
MAPVEAVESRDANVVVTELTDQGAAGVKRSDLGTFDASQSLSGLETFRIMQEYEVSSLSFAPDGLCSLRTQSSEDKDAVAPPRISPALYAHFQEERFKKVKLAYLELESKSRFLDALLSSEHSFFCPPDDSFRELELQVAHSKTKLKKVKQTRETERTELREAVERLARSSTNIEALGAEVAGMQRQLEAVLAAKKIQDMAQSTADDTQAIISTTNAEFLALVSKLDSMRSHIVQRDLNALVAQQSEQNAGLETELHNFRERECALQVQESQLLERIAEYGKLLDRDAPLEAERAKLHDRETQLEVTRRLLERLGGISDVHFSDELMSVTLHVPNASHVLEIMFEPDVSAIQAALMTPPSVISVSELAKTHRTDPFMFVQKVLESLQNQSQ